MTLSVGLMAVPGSSPAGALATVAAAVPVVFDTDMDFDDAAALAYLSQEHKQGRIDLRAVTVTNSGVGLPGLAIHNARCILRRLGLSSIPVADGSPTAPNLAPPELRATVQSVFTTVLLGCLESLLPSRTSAPQLLVNAIRGAPAKVVVIATGPLSNVAAAIRLDAAGSPTTTLADRIAHTYVMGGAVHVPGNVCCTTTLGTDGSQELNAWIDPRAAADTFSALPEGSVSLIPLDATRFVPVRASFIDRLRADQHTAEARLVTAIATHPVVTVGALAGAYWWDPLAAVAATRSGVVGYEDQRIVVVQDGAQSGRTAPSPDGRRIQVGVFAEQIAFEQIFLDTLNGRAV
ncbi:MAG TPA: nucleoside hydrolase [Acidimicrobiales bacterium]|nr:nucleoside hydrolase [Acidimicrobiales bacterium]